MDKKPLRPNTDHKQQMLLFCRILFVALAIVGSVLFYFRGNSLLGGLGLSGSLFGLVSFFHFNKVEKRLSQNIDTNMSWFLLGVMVVGVLLLFGNKMMDGPDFYYGIAAGMAMIGGVAYGLELLFTWVDNT